MGRAINPQPPGKKRNELRKSIALAIRELAFHNEVDTEVKDLSAFIAIALEEIHTTVDQTATAWEKRGYWVKADRFRMEWYWVDLHYQEMIKTIKNRDWERIGPLVIQIAQKVGSIKLPKRNMKETPWRGAWNRLKENNNI